MARGAVLWDVIAVPGEGGGVAGEGSRASVRWRIEAAGLVRVAIASVPGAEKPGASAAFSLSSRRSIEEQLCRCVLRYGDIEAC